MKVLEILKRDNCFQQAKRDTFRLLNISEITVEDFNEIPKEDLKAQAKNAMGNKLRTIDSEELLEMLEALSDDEAKEELSGELQHLYLGPKRLLRQWQNCKNVKSWDEG